MGLIILYTGFGISMSVFMMTGYIKSIPKDIEESAVIDGANIMQAFFYIMLPLIKPMTITIIILMVCGYGMIIFFRSWCLKRRISKP